MSNLTNRPYRSRPLDGLDYIILCVLVAIAFMAMVVFSGWVINGSAAALDSRDHYQQQQTNQILQQGGYNER